MTLKEKVAELYPYCIDEDCVGGVLSCPRDYEELENKYNCGCLEKFINCEACWNQEMED